LNCDFDLARARTPDGRHQVLEGDSSAVKS
jgi:hypothetical protein